MTKSIVEVGDCVTDGRRFGGEDGNLCLLYRKVKRRRLRAIEAGAINKIDQRAAGIVGCNADKGIVQVVGIAEAVIRVDGQGRKKIREAAVGRTAIDVREQTVVERGSSHEACNVAATWVRSATNHFIDEAGHRSAGACRFASGVERETRETVHRERAAVVLVEAAI